MPQGQPFWPRAHRPRPKLRVRPTILVGVALLMAAACSDGGSASDDGEPVSLGDEGVGGPAADLSEELTGGDGALVASTITGAALPDGYVEHEYVASGTASAYQAVGDLNPDGRWSLEPASSDDYRTRMLVRRPAEAQDASGVVVVEWLNVSGGTDADADWMMLHEEITREGHVWIGVSTQLIGVEGGEALVDVDVEGVEREALGLTEASPDRYGSLTHPGDAYAFDIYTQVARALRSESADEALGGIEPVSLVAIGESQSAFGLVSYINGVHPQANAFDGFFVHSRGAGSMPLVEPGEAADITASIGGEPTLVRDDVDVPVFVFQAEGDVTGVLNSAESRQPDTDTFRLWEVAGAAHADTRLAGPTAEALDCGVPINDGPHHVVAKAALRHLVTWVAAGEAPPEAPPIAQVDGDSGEIDRDSDGIALGGVRTPPVDVPTRVLSGEPGPDSSIACLLFGSTVELPDDRLAESYNSREEFEDLYDQAVDDAIAAGFVLEEDRDAILSYAHPELVP